MNKHGESHDNQSDDTRPHSLILEEWKELLEIPDIRESWGLEPDETPQAFSTRVYAAKFHFVSGSPGYVGDLYLLQGDYLTGDPPVVLIRDQDGRLKIAN